MTSNYRNTEFGIQTKSQTHIVLEKQNKRSTTTVTNKPK